MPPTPEMIPIWRHGSTAVLVDQRRLPGAWVDVSIATPAQMAEAIRSLQVRGAPAIGIAGAYGLWLASEALASEAPGTVVDEEWTARLDQAAALLRATRPTAANLGWALARMGRVAEAARIEGQTRAQAAAGLQAEADRIAAEDLAMCRAIGAHGSALIGSGEGILTHCNAGGLATGGYGTALGVIRAAHAAGRRIHVYVDETRPVGQGARLTTYELAGAGIPFTLITDSMAAPLVAAGKIQRIITGADRVTASGDAANKIGTYTLALIAQYHGIPFHIAVPSSSIDLALASGADIPIEERDPDEVTGIWGAPDFFRGVRVANPSFDVIPAALITSFITEQGVLAPPYPGRLAAHLETVLTR